MRDKSSSYSQREETQHWMYLLWDVRLKWMYTEILRKKKNVNWNVCVCVYCMYILYYTRITVVLTSEILLHHHGHWQMRSSAVLHSCQCQVPKKWLEWSFPASFPAMASKCKGGGPMHATVEWTARSAFVFNYSWLLRCACQVTRSTNAFIYFIHTGPLATFEMPLKRVRIYLVEVIFISINWNSMLTMQIMLHSYRKSDF